MTLKELKEEIERSVQQVFKDDLSAEDRVDLIEKISSLLSIYGVIKSIETEGIERIDQIKDNKTKNNNWLKMDGLE